VSLIAYNIQITANCV